MRHLTRLLCPLLVFSIATLYGDLEETAISSEQITKNVGDQAGPFTFLIKYDAIGKTSFTKKEFDDQKLKFHQAETSLNAVVYYNKQHEEGLAVGLGYTYNRIDWDGNPFFDKMHFNAANVILTGFSKRLRDWDWKAQVLYALDADHPSFEDCSTCNLLLWGRYMYSCLTGIHFGFYAETGMGADRIVPLIGFDWQFRKEWRLNAVFPVKMSLVYTYNGNWSALAAIRFFSMRCRLGKNEALSKGILEYRNNGFELALRYDWNPLIIADIHAGYASGGKLKVSNRRHNHASHFDLDGSPYIGAMMNLNF